MKVRCVHWIDLKKDHFGGCSLNKFGGKPSFGVCGVCDYYEGKSRGLGDTIKKLLSFLPIKLVWKNCRCKNRRIALNRRFSYEDF